MDALELFAHARRDATLASEADECLSKLASSSGGGGRGVLLAADFLLCRYDLGMDLRRVEIDPLHGDAGLKLLAPLRHPPRQKLSSTLRRRWRWRRRLCVRVRGVRGGAAQTRWRFDPRAWGQWALASGMYGAGRQWCWQAV